MKNIMTVETTVGFDNIDTARLVYGQLDSTLKRLRSVFNIRATARGVEMKLVGEESMVRNAERFISKLVEIVEKKNSLTIDEVEKVLDEFKPESNNEGEKRNNGSGYYRPTSSATPRTKGQSFYVDALLENEITFCLGPAGTGKTFLAVSAGVEQLKAGNVQKVVLVRPAVEAGESLGFLPGDLQAKINPYLRPLYDSLYEFIDNAKVQMLFDNDIIEIVPLAYMRGRTLSRSFVILDEAQNCTSAQLKMFLTRLGTDSMMAITGDPTQNDLYGEKSSGLEKVANQLKGIEGIAIVKLGRQDIVRHPLVQRILDRLEKGGAK